MSGKRTPILQGLMRGFASAGRARRYLAILIAGGLMIGMMAGFAYVGTPKVYSSGFTLILPGAGSNSSVSLESLGQSSSNAASPFSDQSLSPTENYRKLLQSFRLRGNVAKRLNVPVWEVPPPKIKLINQTKLMYVSVNSPDPERAFELAEAWLSVFENELTELREEEQTLREVAYRSTLMRFEQDVAEAQDRIIEFQSDYGLISLDQFQDLVTRGDQLDRDLQKAKTDLQVANREISRLSDLLGLTPDQAAKIMILNSDPGFMNLQDKLATADSKVAELSNMFGENHPEMRAVAKEAAGLREALWVRGAHLIGFQSFKLMASYQRAANAERAELIASLVQASSEAAGADTRAKAIEADMDKTRVKISELTEPATELAALQRDHQIAETVFASALARIDTNRTDIFASYPLTQTVEAPARPMGPSGPSKKFIFIGAVAAFFLFAMGLGLLWIRLPIIRGLLKTI